MSNYKGFNFLKKRKRIESSLRDARNSSYFSKAHECSSRRYNFLPGDFMSFAFTNRKESYKIVRSSLRTGGTLKKRLVTKIVPFMRLAPFISIRLDYDREKNFPGEVILVGSRVKTFDLRNNLVYTIDQGSANFHDLAEIKQDLDDINVNTPQLIYYDDYLFVEEFVGVQKYERFDNKSVESVLEALKQLFDLYNFKGVREVALTDLEFSRSYYSLKEDALNCLNQESYRRVVSHGDFHIGNIGRKGSEVWIFDWENVSKGFLLDDFFNMIKEQYRYTGKRDYQTQLKTGEYSEEVDKIVSLYQEEFNLEKDEVYEYFIIYLLNKLERRDNRFYADLLRKAIN